MKDGGLLPVIENPVVGQWYRVPCVRMTNFGYVPVHGPWHEDAAVIKFERHHYHCDWRFASNEFFEHVMRTVTVPPWAMSYNGKVHNRVITDFLTEWTLRRKKCRRTMPDFPNAEWVATFEQTYRDHVLPPGCSICPHRGMPLLHGDVKVEQTLFGERRTVVCPGHGLMWDLSTGRVIPRGSSLSLLKPRPA